MSRSNTSSSCDDPKVRLRRVIRSLRTGRVRRTAGFVTAVCLLSGWTIGCSVEQNPTGTASEQTSTGSTGAAVLPSGPSQPSEPSTSSTESTGAESTSQASEVSVPSVGTLMAQAMTNARAATSVRVLGRLLVDGRSSAVQAEGRPNGPNQRLIISGRQWGTFEARAVASGWYLKGDKAFYVVSKNPNAAALAGKWVKLTTAQVTALRGSTVGGLLNLLLTNKDLLSLTETDLPAQVVSYQGRTAYSIGRQLTNDGSEIIVSATEPIQFLELRSRPKENVRLAFSLWNAVPPAPAPPANLIVTP